MGPGPDSAHWAQTAGNAAFAFFAFFRSGVGDRNSSGVREQEHERAGAPAGDGERPRTTMHRRLGSPTCAFS